jgi:hypothetical protein
MQMVAAERVETDGEGTLAILRTRIQGLREANLREAQDLDGIEAELEELEARGDGG